MFCPKCGTRNPDHAKYCFKCGSSFPNVKKSNINDEKLKPLEEGLNKTKDGLKKVSTQLSSKIKPIINKTDLKK